MLKRARNPWAIVLSAAMAAAGCAGDGPPPGGDQTWLGQIQRDVFNPSCATAACHSASTQVAGLSLAPGESYDQLVDVEPQNETARSAGLLLVRPGSVEGSYLAHKISGDLSPGEGSQMPPQPPPLDEDLIADVEAWIAAGASPDAPPPGSGDDPTLPQEPELSAIQSDIFNPNCATAGCHDDTSRAADLSLTRGASYAELVDREPNSSVARENGLLRVAPGNPDRSFLLAKVTDVLAAAEGSIMPPGDTPLAASEVETIRAWIAAGALPDS